MKMLNLGRDRFVNLDNVVSVKLNENPYRGNAFICRYIGETNTFEYELTKEELAKCRRQLCGMSMADIFGGELTGVSDPYEEGGL